MITAAALAPALAADAQAPSFTQLHHTAWTRKEGVPAPVIALAQTRDGWLWLGTPTGLYRYDGTRFIRYEGVTRSVLSLLALPDGGLWIGYTGGGATLMQGARLTEYGTAQGLPPTSVQALALDQDGQVWASAVKGLYRFDGKRWTAVPVARDAPSLPTLNVVASRDGSVWARSGANLVHVQRGAAVAEPVATAASEDWLAAAPDGSVWASGSEAGLRQLFPQLRSVDAKHRLGGEIHFDREGRLWTSADGAVALMKFASDQPAAAIHSAIEAGTALTRAQGFSGRSIIAFLQDREGTIWIGTERGLDRFRRTKVRAVALGDAETAAVTPGAGRTMWVGRWNSGPARIEDGQVTELAQGTDAGAFRRICAHTDHTGVVWICGNRALWRIAGEGTGKVSYPASLDAPVYVQGLAMDRAGVLWLAAANGLFRRSGDKWSQTSMPELADFGVPGAIAADAAGRVLLGYASNRVAVLEGAKVQVLSVDQGLAVGQVKVITPSGDHAWIGGSEGVALCRREHCRSLALANRAPVRSVSGIVQSRQGELWLNGAEGITRVSRRELDAWMNDPSHAAGFQRFDADDGLDGTPSQIRPMPTAAEGGDGTLWFTTSAGVYVVDPAALQSNPMPPPVEIRALRTVGQVFDPVQPMTLPRGTRELSIAYTALSLAIPERVRFRYRLAGVDDAWRDAGDRREAFYTNLGPGPYRFHVVAANEDGVWNEAGASVEFSIQPAVHETLAFRLAAGALALLLVYGAYRWQVRRAQARLRHKFEIRMAERGRIARDLHDTLLQGMHGLILRFHSVLEKVPAGSPVRDSIEAAIERAERVMVEGRDRVRDLRDPGQAESLFEALDREGAALARDGAAAFVPTLIGAERALHPVVRDEVFLVAREAMSNAMRHAQARRVELTVEYGARELRVGVSDDGAGIEEAVLRAGLREGRWGLVGMKERAAKVGAHLEIQSPRGQGTRVLLTVPARIAYAESAMKPGWLRRLYPREQA